MIPTTAQLFDLTHSIAGEYLASFQYPWEALAGIGKLIRILGPTLPEEEFDHPAEDIWIAKDAEIYETACIKGPCIIGHRSEIRHGAFIRRNVIAGDNCVIGNATEVKNSILFDRVQLPHYNYVGDSVLGFRAHMSAGAMINNVRHDRTLVVIRDGYEKIPTNRKKVGAIIGDEVEIGCNSVLNPGTIIGKGSYVYPLCSVQGVVPSLFIYKDSGPLFQQD